VVGNSILLGRFKPKLPLAKAELQKTRTQEDTDKKEITDELVSKSSFS
jgi:hypothetical protein